MDAPNQPGTKINEKTGIVSPVDQASSGENRRNQDGTWPKGVSGNPEGRPKGISITEMVREALEDIEEGTKKPWKELIIKRILTKSIKEGDTQLIKTIWNYLDGMPKQNVSLEGNPEEPLVIKIKDGSHVK